MSQSFADDGGIERGGTGSSEGSLDEQLAAEIADHLAAAASDLMRRGEAEDQAAKLALARFGDVARVKRQCWWIHNGEEVMFRTVGIALLSLLTIGVTVVGLGGWQLQRNLALRTEELSAQLASLTVTQQAMLTQQRPPEITGVAYLGHPSVPAKDVEIQVFRFSEEPPSVNSPRATGVVTRRLRTDALGRFDSGVLQSGEYCLLGPLMDPHGKANEHEFLFKQLQSRPLYLTAGVEETTVDLDLAASGRIRLGVTGIPNSFTIAGEEVRVFVNIIVSTDGVPYFERKPVPPSDEPPRDGWPLPLPPTPHDVVGAALRPADLPRAWWLPPRDYSVTLQLSSVQSKSNGSPPIAIDFGTKRVPLALKVMPDITAMVTLNVLGDPLEKRFEAAVKEVEKNSQAKLGLESFVPLLRRVADGIELNVALAMQETAVALADEKQDRTIKGFGTVIDPDGDCQVKEENARVTIVVPKTHHDLTYTEKYSKLNSPRVLQDTKGDFCLEAKVEVFELPNNKTSSGGDYSFVSSGLLIWQDDHNFIRIDRAAVSDSPFVWVERFQAGKSVSQKQFGIENDDTYLRATRKGDKFTFETSKDGKDWVEVLVDEAKLADQLKVGVLAINTTNEEFSVKLKDLKLSQSPK